MESNYTEVTILSDGTRAKIAPGRGGLVTSFSVNGREILYLDRETFTDPIKNVRGGIPILFPNAGPLKGSLYHLPQHGFARRMVWNVISRQQDSITMRLVSNKETEQNYPFYFEMELKVVVAGNRLIHSLSLNNTGDKPMPIAYGIHPYFQIGQEEKAKLKTNIIGFAPQEINWLDEFDQAFKNPGQTMIDMPAKEMKIESDADIFRFIRIWHQPGGNFICFEPWTRDNYALDNPAQSMWIEPQKTVYLTVAVTAR